MKFRSHILLWQLYLFQVVRAAEECAATLASYIPPAQSIRILIPIIQTSMFPINLAAIKMQTKVVELMAAPALTPLLDELMPGLLKVRAIVNENDCVYHTWKKLTYQ